MIEHVFPTFSGMWMEILITFSSITDITTRAQIMSWVMSVFALTDRSNGTVMVIKL